MAVHPQVSQTVLDAVDVRELAEFYRELLGYTYRPGDEPPVDGFPDDADWLVLRGQDGGPTLAFQQTAQLTPTTWPSPEVPMQLHLDMTVTDRESLEAVRRRAESLGGVWCRMSPTTPTSSSTCLPTRPATPSACSSRESPPRGVIDGRVAAGSRPFVRRRSGVMRTTRDVDRGWTGRPWPVHRFGASDGCVVPPGV